MQSATLKGVGISKSTLTLNIKMQTLDFVLLAFCLAFVQYFLTVLLFSPFEMVMHIPCHYILEVYDLIFNFYFIGG